LELALVTGATGFIGRRLVDTLRRRGVKVVILTRDARKTETLWSSGSIKGICADLSSDVDLREACQGVESIYHLAGHAHAADQDSPGAAHLHFEITVNGTRRLLEAATAAGVRRFVFLSSVKAMSEGSDDCLDEATAVAPTTTYGRAKLEAERLILAAGRERGMHVCVLRLPLVYGPGNKGNIPRMIAAIDKGWFPLLPETHNRRSMVHVDDVVQALLLAAETPAANGQVYIVTDGQIYTTREIYVAICRALDRRVPARPVPAWSLRAGAAVGDALEAIAGRRMPLNSGTLEKLLGSAWYSSEKIRRELGFRARHTLLDALPKMIAEYRSGAQALTSSAG
jgi:UDP-glucose 4-epimerase